MTEGMFVAVARYRVRQGREAELLVVHERWKTELCHQAQGFISEELLEVCSCPRAYISISRWESEGAYWASWEHPLLQPWYHQLESVLEEDITPIRCQRRWQVEPEHHG